MTINNCMDISSDNQENSFAKRLGRGYERETLRVETESFLIAAQHNAIRTNYAKAKRNKCYKIASRDETFNHIRSE